MRKRTPQGTSAACRRVTLEGLEDRSLLSAAHLALTETHFSPHDLHSSPHQTAVLDDHNVDHGHASGHGDNSRDEEEYSPDDHNVDHGHASSHGIGQTVKWWAHEEGLHGKDLAARIHDFLQLLRPDEVSSNPNHPPGIVAGSDDPGVGDPGSGDLVSGNPSPPGQDPGGVPPVTPAPTTEPEVPQSPTPAATDPADGGTTPPVRTPPAGKEVPLANRGAVVVDQASGAGDSRVLLASALATAPLPLLEASRFVGGAQGAPTPMMPVEPGAGRGETSLGPIGAGLNGVLTGAGPVLPALVEFAPDGVGAPADLLPSLAFADAELDRVFSQIVDWSSSDEVRDWLPWLSGAALAAAALDLARRQVRRSAKRHPALPDSVFSAAGWPSQDSP